MQMMDRARARRVVREQTLLGLGLALQNRDVDSIEVGLNLMLMSMVVDMVETMALMANRSKEDSWIPTT